MGTSIYQIVNDKIIEQLKKGVIPWRKPWKQAGVPSNFISKKAYRGINVFLLACAGYSSPYWLSFKQCAGLGGQVRKGEKSTLVIYWKILESWKEDVNGKKQLKKVPLLRYYNVFNVEQCEGLKLPAVVEGGEKLDFQPIELAEAVRDGYLDAPDYQELENSAYYSPARDLVNLPRKENFKSIPAYYATLFHELVHSTGHGDRLSREGFLDGASFGSEKYSKEELVAEFGASFLCGLCGIESELENSASYISGWMQKINENEKWLVTSATQAQKAVEYMLGVYYGQQAVEAVPAVEVEAEPVEAVTEFSTGADSNPPAVEKEKYIELWREQVRELGRLNWNLNTAGRVKLADIQAELYKLIVEASDYREGGEFSTGIKSIQAGELVRLKNGKIGEVLEVSEDGKACKVHIRTGERVPDKFYKEYELKKGGL